MNSESLKIRLRNFDSYFFRLIIFNEMSYCIVIYIINSEIEDLLYNIYRNIDILISLLFKEYKFKRDNLSII